MTTDTLTPTQWAAFDEFATRIGNDDEWTRPPPWHLQPTYAALVAAGLMERAPARIGLGLYGLTPTGRSAVCDRSGHDFNRRNPSPHGCPMCRRGRCPDCEGSGGIAADAIERIADDIPCVTCYGTGIMERRGE